MGRGRVYWITGLSSSGKTTIGTALYYDLRKKNDNVVILDGDIMRDITADASIGVYSTEGRIARAKRYQALSKLLSDQGLTVIVCTIAMYDSVRSWNRKHIKGYIEIFVDVPEGVRKARDKKGVYNNVLNTAKDGRKDSDIELPKTPDIRIVNDGSASIRSFIEEIKAIEPADEEDFDRDRSYWNKFYTNIEDGLAEPSQFAKNIMSKLSPGKHLLELGCGNGRDSLFFIKNGIRVTALDASDIAVDYLNSITKENDNALFVCDDFVKCQSLYQLRYDYIYSRFTLHAIDDEQEDELLHNIRTGLSPGGKLFIEARTIHDDIYGLGKQVAKNAYIYNNHYRRFIDVELFKKKVEDFGFEIEYLKEKAGFSKREDSDPILMRLIATVPESILRGGIEHCLLIVTCGSHRRSINRSYRRYVNGSFGIAV